MKITIVYDNDAPPPFKSDWGFACLVETEKTTLLFDTGANSNILLENMKKLHLDPKNIQVVMLSHDHWDHTGGLSGLLTINPKITIYKPTFSNTPRQITPGFMTTGYLSSWSGIQEQSLLCDTKEGKLVITGCSHPGLENILITARQFGKIYAVIGGFHGFNKLDTLKGISIIVPCHCTSHKPEIQKLFPTSFQVGGVGKVIEL